MEISFYEIEQAYIKLKSYIYYDSTNLYLRAQLAIFETNTNLPHGHKAVYDKMGLKKENNLSGSKTLYKNKLRIITNALINYEKEPDFFSYFLDQIKIRLLPKKIENIEPSPIITNRRQNNYKIEKLTAFIDAPIENPFNISTLDIKERGRYGQRIVRRLLRK